MLIEKWTKDRKVLEIFTDDSSLNPREEFENCGVMYCWHPSYRLGDKQTGEVLGEFWQTELLAHKGLVLALYLYDHSGLRLSTASFECPWDSAQVGFILLPKEVQEREGLTDEQAKACLEAEVEVYNQYLSGEVYGYKTYTMKHCSACGYSNRAEKDACWGFYGADHLGSGLLEQAGIESLEGWTNANI